MEHPRHQPPKPYHPAQDTVAQFEDVLQDAIDLSRRVQDQLAR
jgi:hypothetical protein